MAFRPRGDGLRPRFGGPPRGNFRPGGPPRGFGPRFPPGRSGPPRGGPPPGRGGPPPGRGGPPPGRGGPPSRFQSRGPGRGGPFPRGPRPLMEEQKSVPSNDVEKAPEKVETKPEEKTQEENKVGLDVIPLAPKDGAAKERITLDEYNCDLHFQIEGDGLIGSTLHKDGFEYMWGGGRATHGVSKGRVCFEVEILEELPVQMPPSEKTPHVLRVGWSVDNTSYQLGEDELSYGYGGTAKSSLKGKFTDYGKRYGCGDIIGCFADLDSTPKAIFFTLNGEYLGIAFKIGRELDGKALFPHINGKNIKFSVNFGEKWPKYPLTARFGMIDASPKDSLVRGPKAPSKSDAEIIMMVGLPAAGKSCWAENYLKEHPDKRYYILGTNNIIDKMKVMGLTRKRNYHGRWDELIKQATACLNVWLKLAERKVRNYILDQTNVYFTARRRKMKSFQGYKRIAAVLVNEPKVLKERTTKREREEGKMVPESAIMEMKANFSIPEKGESFEEIMFVEEKPPKATELVANYKREGLEHKQGAGGKRPNEADNRNTGPMPKIPRSDNNFQQGKQGFTGGPRPRAPFGEQRGGPAGGTGPRFGPRGAQQDFRKPFESNVPPKTDSQFKPEPSDSYRYSSQRDDNRGGNQYNDRRQYGNNDWKGGERQDQYSYSNPRGPGKPEPAYTERDSYRGQGNAQAGYDGRPVKQESYDGGYRSHQEGNRSQWNSYQGDTSGGWNTGQSNQPPKSEDRRYGGSNEAGYYSQTGTDYKSWGGNDNRRDTTGQQSYDQRPSQAYSSYGGNSSQPPPSYGRNSSQPPPSYGGNSSQPPPSYGGNSSQAPPSYGGNSSQAPPSYGGSSNQSSQSGLGYDYDSKPPGGYRGQSYGTGSYDSAPSHQQNHSQGYQGGQQSGYYNQPIKKEPVDNWDYQGQSSQYKQESSYSTSTNYQQPAGTYGQNTSSATQGYDQKSYYGDNSSYYGQTSTYSQINQSRNYPSDPASNVPSSSHAQAAQSQPGNYWQYGSQPAAPSASQSGPYTGGSTAASGYGQPPAAQPYGGYNYGR